MLMAFSRAGEGSDRFQQLEVGPFTGDAGPPQSCGAGRGMSLSTLFLVHARSLGRVSGVEWLGLHLSHQVQSSESNGSRWSFAQALQIEELALRHHG